MITINPVSFPLDTPGDEAQKMFESPHMTVYGIALRSDPQSLSSTFDHIESSSSTVPESSKLPFDPLARSFRPTSLSATHLRQWTDTVVGDMFGKRTRAPEVSTNPPRSHPLTTADGTVRFARADMRYAISPAGDTDVETEMVYICQAPDVRGKFDVKKAMALGVPNGPSRGMLVKGMDIEVDDPEVEGGKRIIKPEDCLVGGGPGAVCPSCVHEEVADE
jgi:ribonuclease Z